MWSVSLGVEEDIVDVLLGVDVLCIFLCKGGGSGEMNDESIHDAYIDYDAYVGGSGAENVTAADLDLALITRRSL